MAVETEGLERHLGDQKAVAGVDLSVPEGEIYGFLGPNGARILFFPFALLTTAFLPREALTGWLHTITARNPVTYLLHALRSLGTEGWEAATLLHGVLAIAARGALSLTLAFAALRGRVRRG